MNYVVSALRSYLSGCVSTIRKRRQQHDEKKNIRSKALLFFSSSEHYTYVRIFAEHKNV